jgi:prepilin peptidase CpaA
VLPFPGHVVVKQLVPLMAGLVGVIAGVTDWRWRRIPNWLTVQAAAIGLGVNLGAWGWAGAKSSLLGLGLGLLVLLPFVLIRALGAGDWKLAGAIGAILGPSQLLLVLGGSVLIAGVMALVLVIYKGRFIRTLRNMGTILVRLFTGHPGDPSVSLDNPESLKVPFGVAMAMAVVVFVGQRIAQQVS